MGKAKVTVHYEVPTDVEYEEAVEMEVDVPVTVEEDVEVEVPVMQTVTNEDVLYIERYTSVYLE